MSLISDEQRDAISRRIVEDFGDGKLLPDKYLFEQITRLPTGFSDHRMKVSDAVSTITDHDVIVLLDTHPNNRKSAEEVSEYIGKRDAFAFRLSKNVVANVLRFDQCDMYVTTVDGRLVIVGCHEDSVVDEEREVWVPMMDNEQ
jgi:hypothetical protein